MAEKKLQTCVFNRYYGFSKEKALFTPCAKCSSCFSTQPWKCKPTAGRDRCHSKARKEPRASLVTFVKYWIYLVLDKLGNMMWSQQQVQDCVHPERLLLAAAEPNRLWLKVWFSGSWLIIYLKSFPCVQFLIFFNTLKLVTFMFLFKCQRSSKLKTTSRISEFLSFWFFFPPVIQGWKEFSALINWRIKISIQLSCRVFLPVEPILPQKKRCLR